MFRSGEFGGKTDCTNHAQRVVTVGRVRIERGADYSGREVAYSSERIYQCPKVILLEAERHRVDREVTAQLVFAECAVLDYWLAGFPPVAFLSRANELDFHAVIFQHRSSEILEYRNMYVITFLFPAKTFVFFYV